MITAALGTDDADAIALAGGKAARLSALIRTFPVPRGFVVTTEGFRDWKHDGGGNLPQSIEAEIDRALDEVSFPVAVRSSGADEDGAIASFAGMHETFLNLRRSSAVREAVVACWRSAGHDVAAAYRQERKLAAGEMAVLVQEMIEAETSGVAFTVNPVAKDSNEILINAAWGLGPSIVDGTVTPDTFIVSRSATAIAQRQISEKDVMTVLSEGGTTEVTVPSEMRSKASLSDEQCLQVARLGMKLEAFVGWPADYEWAFAGGRLWLLQCRPITTL